MPIYEFYCPDNNKLYSFLARSGSHRHETPQCPDNPAWRLEKRISGFAIIGKAKEENEDDPFADVDDTKMENLMAEMEAEMSGLEDSNPNPRQLGHLIRKMTDMMGDKSPPELREMVRRLEAGEDPEKLESEYSDLEGEAGEALFGQMKKIIHAVRKPVRDPKLYEIRDYLPGGVCAKPDSE